MSKKEIEILKIVHRSQADKRLADRIKTILSLNEGLSYAEISRILLLDDDTIRGYYKTYSAEGIKGLLQLNYTGGLSYLSSEEIEELDAYLCTNMYQSSKEIAYYIESKYEVVYTVEGIRDLLRRLNFVFKKTGHLPGKGDVGLQKEFVEKYNEIKANKGKEDQIYFADAVHPLHNCIVSQEWILYSLLSPSLSLSFFLKNKLKIFLTILPITVVN